MMWPTDDDLRVLLGHDLFDVQESERAELLIDLAVGLVEAEARQTLTQSSDTAELDGTGTSFLVLPRWPVTDVSSVTIRDEDPLIDGFTFTNQGLVERTSGVWPSGHGNIEVAYTAGFATISDDLKRVVLSVASRGWASPVGVRQESLGDHSVTYETSGLQLSTNELQVVRRYQASTPR